MSLWGIVCKLMRKKTQFNQGVIISSTVANKSFYWTNSGMLIPVLFRLLTFKNFFNGISGMNTTLITR